MVGMLRFAHPTGPRSKISWGRCRAVTGHSPASGSCTTTQGRFLMEEKTIDQAAMGRLAKALVFICGPDHPTTVALQAAARTGSERDIKNARTLFLRLKPG